MSSLKVTLCTGVAVAAAVLIPTAYASGEGGADGAGSILVTPSTPAPGSQITLKVSGCGGRTATAVSVVFVADAQLVGSGGTLSGDTQVRSSITAGTYDVQITCVDLKVKGRIKVVGPTSPGLPESDGLTPPGTSPGISPAPATPATPVAPVHAGGGGTAPLAAAAEDARVRVDSRGPGTVQAVIGLVLVGVAATAVVFRGVRRRNRAD
ncbi:hypothetical protein ABZ725_27110 [Streptomyces sp. NPDC006872]|uniref:hypothetical protein n=1 Tax=Streptomyces sp. NPDC006872 TaxID=3155720 RepID=UPI0033F8DA19